MTKLEELKAAADAAENAFAAAAACNRAAYDATWAAYRAYFAELQKQGEL